MAFLFASQPSTYADEQATVHLGALATLPVTFPPTLSGAEPKPSPYLQSALHELSSSRAVSRDRLVAILSSLAAPDDREKTFGASDVDRVVEAEVISRALTVVWKEVMQAFVDGALELEEERGWWDAALSSRHNVFIYLIQTLPLRLYRAVQPSSLSLPSLHAFRFPPRAALFRPLSAANTALTSLTSPLTLTRHEMLASRRALAHARDTAAYRIGVLASRGPRWADAQDTQVQGGDMGAEAARVYGVVAHVLEIPPPAAPTPPPKRSRGAAVAPPALASAAPATPAALLSVLTTHLPRAQRPMRDALATHGRPSALTRLWFPLLFVPPALYVAASAVARNRAWMWQQVRDARDTVRGFFVSWVWEPVEDIAKTLRQGGQGLGVAPTTVQADQASLERMVVDLGRDYYHLDGPALDTLSAKVRSGDLTEVLRAYESELKSPLKNALMGSLVRTLLIQVQKAKTDVSLSLLSLDHLLRSQQLTFAAVGVAPSFLVLYALDGWLRGVWRGEKRGRGRTRRYFGRLRDVERILLTAPEDDQRVTERDRGLLIVGVSGLRSWAAGLGRHREPRQTRPSGLVLTPQAFLDDLRMVEDPALSRADKLGVVARIWRCWGVDGRGGPK